MKIAFLAALALVSISLSACGHTWNGMGEDTAHIGHAVSNSSGVHN